MPYFIYRVGPFAQLRKLAEFDAFRPASAHAAHRLLFDSWGLGAGSNAAAAENGERGEEGKE